MTKTYDTYKDSGIAWIGEIPSEWKIVRQKNIFTLGKELVGESWSSTQLLSLTTKGIKCVNIGTTSGKVPDSYNTYQIVKPNNLVMCLFDLDCSAVFSGLSNCDGMISPAYKVLTVNESSDPRYYAYWFDYIFDGRKYMFLSKNIRYSLTYDEFASLGIVMPSLKEQQTIATFLDKKCSEIDSLISLQEEMITELQAYKQSIITEVVTKGLDSHVKMKESGVEWIGQIPIHWTPVYPKILFTQRNDRAQKGDRQLAASQKYGIVYQDEYMRQEGVNLVTVEKNFDILKHVEPNDFVISMRSFQGGLEYSDKTGCISSAYVMLIPNEDKVYPPFFRWFFKSSKYINALQSTSNFVRDGQAMRFSHFIKLTLFDIPLPEQKAIANFLNIKIPQIDSLIALKHEKIEELKDYKKSIIYEYVTGKKRV